MANWFECKVKFDKTMEDGLVKRVSETYLVDAMSFTEAERRFTEEITPFMGGEYEITDIKKARIFELFESNDANAAHWYKAKVAFITIDEKTAVEKRTVQTDMVQSTDFPQAVKDLQKVMDAGMGDYVIVSIAETSIMDVFHYQAPGENVKPEFPEA